MKSRILFSKLIILAAAIFFTACDNKPQFTIKGNIADAKEQTLYLEKRSITGVASIDSTKIKKDGSFEIKADAPQYPDLYILKLGKEAINLSVDSIETIEIKSSTKSFSSNYEVSGSESSVKIKQTVEAYQKVLLVVRDLQKKHKDGKIEENLYIASIDSALAIYKQGIKKIIASDFKSPAAYFALFQKIDNFLLLDPYDKEDGKMYTAVATAWDTFHKDSERSKHLYDFTIKILKEKRQASQGSNLNPIIQQAEIINLFDITLPDINGNNVALTSLRGKVILLDFTSYQTDYSAAYNMKLNEAYKQFAGQFEIYQIALDADAHLWKNAAINLPWTCVREAQSVNSDLLAKYNITNIPTAFLINKNGELVKRLTDIRDLKSEIQKLL